MNTTTQFKFACPSCAQHLTAETEHIGQSIECPACHDLITVPKPMTLAMASPPVMPAAAAQPPAPGYAAPAPLQSPPTGLVIASWLMIGVTCLVSLIPGVGFLTWLIAAPILLVTFVLGIVALNKGATTQGILILLASVIAAPVFLFVAPILTTTAAVTGAAATAVSVAENATPSFSGSSEASLPPASNGNGTSAAKGTSHAIGETVEFGDSTWVVLSAREVGDSLPKQMFAKERKSDGGKFIYVRYKVTNKTNEEEQILFVPAVRDSKGRRYEELDESEMYLPDGETGMTIEPLPASLPRTFSALFEVAADSTGMVFLARSLGFDKEEKPVALNLEATAQREQTERQQSAVTDAAKREADAADLTKTREAAAAADQAKQAREVKDKLTTLKGELAVLNTNIETERARWQTATNTINRLTNNKRTPVQEGSQPYFQCLAASKVIQEVEAGAAELKAEKARLEAMIRELEK